MRVCGRRGSAARWEGASILLCFCFITFSVPLLWACRHTGYGFSNDAGHQRCFPPPSIYPTSSEQRYYDCDPSSRSLSRAPAQEETQRGLTSWMCRWLRLQVFGSVLCGSLLKGCGSSLSKELGKYRWATLLIHSSDLLTEISVMLNLTEFFYGWCCFDVPLIRLIPHVVLVHPGSLVPFLFLHWSGMQGN